MSFALVDEGDEGDKGDESDVSEEEPPKKKGVCVLSS
jgi:hypothetical protein